MRLRRANHRAACHFGPHDDGADPGTYAPAVNGQPDTSTDFGGADVRHAPGS